MPVLDAPGICLEAGPLAMAINRGRFDERLKQTVAECLEVAGQLIKPKAVYDYFNVEQAGENHIFLKGPGGSRVKLTVGKRADLLTPSRLVQVGVVTIGPELEQKNQQINQTGDVYKGYILDCVGVALLAEVGNILDRLAEQYASDHGWGVGYRLAPGSLDGWAMTDQLVLGGLLPLANIGVTINQSGVLTPHKSAVSVIGLGPGFTAKKVYRVCHLCPKAAGCYRADLASPRIFSLGTS